MIYTIIILAIWAAWVAYWMIAAADTKPATRRETLMSATGRVALLVLAVLLVATGRPDAPPDWAAWLYWRVFPFTFTTYWIGVAILTAGLGFAVWARRHLGTNWSSAVTVKEDHVLIRSGPYRFVRHPIYTGILFGFVGTAVALGQVRGIISVALVLVSFARKLRLEERWMMETFGERYADYRREVKALIPFIL